ncbi:MAG TPA: AbrB/MazE/SpoVT family DNA-binding domain-containing protein [Armatimonadota bacterium]|nr:AbrB/MazE/SpoVT family DNA-binding domain-containing protein [Armatimonadota bacterium]HQK94406.1 AbrB/MazE/SpoVT family DNA-binding domain-containing protein [Armatimonadota bacterium]
MASARVSSKGQITLPAALRRKFGIGPSSTVEVEGREGEIVIRPLRSVSEVRGAFRHCVADGPMDWSAAREQAQRTVAEQVAHE